MSVSTATLERSRSAMRRVKTYLRATMKTKRLSALAPMHAYKDITINGEAVARGFCGKENRILRELPIPIKLDLRYLGRHSVQEILVITSN